MPHSSEKISNAFAKTLSLFEALKTKKKNDLAGLQQKILSYEKTFQGFTEQSQEILSPPLFSFQTLIIASNDTAIQRKNDTSVSENTIFFSFVEALQWIQEKKHLYKKWILIFDPGVYDISEKIIFPKGIDITLQGSPFDINTDIPEHPDPLRVIFFYRDSGTFLIPENTDISILSITLHESDNVKHQHIAIHGQGYNLVSLKNCFVSRFQKGICLVHNGSLEIIECRFSDNKKAFYLSAYASAILERSRFLTSPIRLECYCSCRAIDCYFQHSKNASSKVPTALQCDVSLQVREYSSAYFEKCTFTATKNDPNTRAYSHGYAINNSNIAAQQCSFQNTSIALFARERSFVTLQKCNNTSSSLFLLNDHLSAAILNQCSGLTTVQNLLLSSHILQPHHQFTTTGHIIPLFDE